MELTPKQFIYLKAFTKIIVSGPQRSGTRICAQMIAHDINYDYIDEKDYSGNTLKKFQGFVTSPQKVVLQAPAVSRWVHLYSRTDVVIIFMQRNIKDIIASQKRIDWKCEPLEFKKYGEKSGVISKIKYKYWNEVQKPSIDNWFEIDYESLSVHKLWLPKPKRKNFEWDQTKEAKKSSKK